MIDRLKEEIGAINIARVEGSKAPLLKLVCLANDEGVRPGVVTRVITIARARVREHGVTFESSYR